VGSNPIDRAKEDKKRCTGLTCAFCFFASVTLLERRVSDPFSNKGIEANRNEGAND
jgi:hypothetical protein